MCTHWHHLHASAATPACLFSCLNCAPPFPPVELSSAGQPAQEGGAGLLRLCVCGRPAGVPEAGSRGRPLSVSRCLPAMSAWPYSNQCLLPHPESVLLCSALPSLSRSNYQLNHLLPLPPNNMQAKEVEARKASLGKWKLDLLHRLMDVLDLQRGSGDKVRGRVWRTALCTVCRPNEGCSPYVHTVARPGSHASSSFHSRGLHAGIATRHSAPFLPL